MPEFELPPGIASLPEEDWDRLVGPDGSPFAEWGFLASLEEAGTVGEDSGWESRPLLARSEGRLVGACPLYVKSHSEGEFVFDWGWADAAQRAGIHYYPKLLVGVPFTPAGGRRFLLEASEEPEEWWPAFGLALRKLADENDISSVHVNFCEQAEAEALQPAGYETRVGVQYHWFNRDYGDFEGYLQAFRSKRRNQIRRELRELESQGVRIETHVGDEIPDSLFAPMFRFYRSTIHAKFYGRQYLNPEVFALFKERFRERLCFIVAMRDGEPIAGTFNVQKNGVLYGRYWGADVQLRHLHFNVCYYAAIRHCIENGIDRFEPGAGGDYKQLRGFDATPTWSAHYVADSRLRAAVSRFLEQEREQAEEAIEWMRTNSVLKPSR